MAARTQPGFAFEHPQMFMPHPEVTLLWVETTHASLGTTGWRTEVFACEGGEWQWKMDYGVILPRTSATVAASTLRAEPARPDSSLVARIVVPGEGTIEVSLNPAEHTLSGWATPIAVTAIALTGVIDRVAVSRGRAAEFLNRGRPTPWQATADSGAAWLRRPALVRAGQQEPEYFAGLVGEGWGLMVPRREGAAGPTPYVVDFRFGGPVLRLNSEQVSQLFDAIRRAIGQAVESPRLPQP